MNKLSFAVLVVALAGCGDSAPPAAPAPSPAAPPASAQPAPAPAPQAKVAEALKADPNRELAARVKRALEEDAKVQAAGIDVTAAEGTVTLWGTTTTETERSRAARAATQVEGVKSVTNKLAVVRGS
jgi:hyperosmotically inducible periplasmic protein